MRLRSTPIFSTTNLWSSPEKSASLLWGTRAGAGFDLNSDEGLALKFKLNCIIIQTYLLCSAHQIKANLPPPQKIQTKGLAKNSDEGLALKFRWKVGLKIQMKGWP